MILVPLLAAAVSCAAATSTETVQVGVPAAGAPTAAKAPFALRDGDRVVFYGDSITQDGAYARFVEEYVRTRFPRWDVRFYNAGVGGDTVRGGGAGPIDVRLTRDVIAFRPTVVTIMLGMNDGGYKRFDPMTLASYGEGYRAIVERLQHERPGVRLTLIRPSPFDDIARPPLFAPGYDDTLRRLGCYVVTLASSSKADVADFRESVNAGLAAVLKENPDLARQLVPDRVHPGPAGHVLMGATLLRTWNAPSLVSRVAIDAAALKVASAEKATVSDLAPAAGGLAWTQLDESLPLPVSFDDATIELAQRAGADLESLDEQKLAVTGLAPGRYELRIDGKPAATLAAEELARGVNLARLDTPMRWQAFSVAWSTSDGHELQKLRRRLLVAGEKDASLLATADALAARDEADQRSRSEQAVPKPRKLELVPLR
jgi:lysophospholipase L1-like esterase